MTLPEPRAAVTFLVLLIGALASGYVLTDLLNEKEKAAKPDLSLAYYLNDAELTGTGPDGSILFQVWTRTAAQSKYDEDIDMDIVRIHYGPPTALPWELRANRGRIPADAAVIELTGEVVAVSKTEGEPATIIRTDRLDVDPTTRNATTDADVTLEFDGRTIAAKGMLANFETNEVRLLSDVHGRFLP
jgi:lipopolysaccharide export system protein LptC